MHPDRRFAIQLLVSSGEAYILHCNDDKEARQWYNVLQKAIKDAYSRNQNGRLMKSDWLIKKNQRRYFVLQRGVLSWYLNQGDPQPKGSLDLKNCTLSPVINEDTFVITASYMNKEYRMTCPAGVHQARAWVKILSESLETAQKNQEETYGTAVKNVSGDIIKSGWLEKKGQKRYFKLTNGVLAWYNQNPNERPDTRMNGSLNLKGCQISQSGFNFHIRPAAGKIYVLKATTVLKCLLRKEGEAFGWVTALLSTVKKADVESTKALDPNLLTITQGWVIKKYMGSRKEDRRYIVLEQNKLKYYDREPSSGVVPKGEIFLGQSQVSMMNVTTFVVATGQGRDYPWQCVDALTTQQWVNSIQFMIFQANESIQKSVQKHQWLVGGRGTPGDRWVVISKDNKLLWFDHVMPPEHINEKDANGFLPLQGVKVGTNAAKKLSFAVAAPRQAPLIWTTPDESSSESWVKSIHAVAKGQFVRDVMPKLVLGVPLAKLLEREAVDIPKLVTKCCAHIKEHGKDQVGIFRLSGRASEIDMFIEQFNSGADVKFSTANDVNAVAGLLKAFLREMPDPIFPFDFYDAIISAQDIPSMRQLISRLPKPHLDLATYLFGFLHNMCQFSTITKMDPSNYAICIGPNVIRRKEDENGNGLAEFPQVLNATTTLIANFPSLFEASAASAASSSAPPQRPVFAPSPTTSRPPPGPPSSLPPSLPPPQRHPPLSLGLSRIPSQIVAAPLDSDPPPPEDDPEDPPPPDDDPDDPTPPSPSESPRVFSRAGGSPPVSPRQREMEPLNLNDFTFLSSTDPSGQPLSPNLTQSGNYQFLASQSGYRASAAPGQQSPLSPKSGNYNSLSTSPGYAQSNPAPLQSPLSPKSGNYNSLSTSSGYVQPNPAARPTLQQSPTQHGQPANPYASQQGYQPNQGAQQGYPSTTSQPNYFQSAAPSRPQTNPPPQY